MQITFVRVFIIITYVLCVICNLGRLSSWVSHICHFYSLVRLYIYMARYVNTKVPSTYLRSEGNFKCEPSSQ